LDQDSNGKLTEKEMGSNQWKRFSRFDADHDSALSLKEMTTAVAAWRLKNEKAGVGHNSWTKTYATDEFWVWLFKQSK
jgi:hypothetical protein